MSFHLSNEWSAVGDVLSFGVSTTPITPSDLEGPAATDCLLSASDDDNSVDVCFFEDVMNQEQLQIQQREENDEDLGHVSHDDNDSEDQTTSIDCEPSNEEIPRQHEFSNHAVNNNPSLNQVPVPQFLQHSALDATQPVHITSISSMGVHSHDSFSLFVQNNTNLPTSQNDGSPCSLQSHNSETFHTGQSTDSTLDQDATVRPSSSKPFLLSAPSLPSKQSSAEIHTHDSCTNDQRPSEQFSHSHSTSSTGVHKSHSSNYTIHSPIQSKKRSWQVAFPEASACVKIQSRVGQQFQASLPPLRRKRRRLSNPSSARQYATSSNNETRNPTTSVDDEEYHMKLQPLFVPGKVSESLMDTYLVGVRSFLAEQQTVPQDRVAKLPYDTFEILSECAYNTEEALKFFKCKYSNHVDESELDNREKQLFGCMAQKFRNKRTGARKSPNIRKMLQTKMFHSERKISDMVNHYFQHEYVSDVDESESDEDEMPPVSRTKTAGKSPCTFREYQEQQRKLRQQEQEQQLAAEEEDEEAALSLQMRRPLD